MGRGTWCPRWWHVHGCCRSRCSRHVHRQVHDAHGPRSRRLGAGVGVVPQLGVVRMQQMAQSCAQAPGALFAMPHQAVQHAALVAGQVDVQSVEQTRVGQHSQVHHPVADAGAHPALRSAVLKMPSGRFWMGKSLSAGTSAQLCREGRSLRSQAWGAEVTRTGGRAGDGTQARATFRHGPPPPPGPGLALGHTLLLAATCCPRGWFLSGPRDRSGLCPAVVPSVVGLVRPGPTGLLV